MAMSEGREVVAVLRAGLDGGRPAGWRTVLTAAPRAADPRRASPGEARFARGDWVEVRPAAEILATLDASGALAGVPFMPEMAPLCGRRFQVARRADMLCVEGSGLRTLGGSVFLEGSRCDGSAHDGCQRGCATLWREAWLRPASSTGPAQREDAAATARLMRLPTRQGTRYLCQSTALDAATTGPLGKWQVGHLLRDWREGALRGSELAAIVARALVNNVRRRFSLGELGQLSGEAERPARGALDLQPGERVRIRSAAEIAPTLDAAGKNRGLSFEPEMTARAGEVHRVAGRIERIIHEETGRMVKLSHTVRLEAVDCRGVCAKNCPRANPLFWREAWLERVDAPAGRQPA